MSINRSAEAGLVVVVAAALTASATAQDRPRTRPANWSEATVRTIPLFRESELAQAFSLLLPDSTAQEWAGDWFEMLSPDEVDEKGYFLYSTEPLDDEDVAGSDFDNIGFGTRAPTQGGADRPAPLSTSELRLLLMRFSDLHLNLVALVSPQAEEKVRRLRNETEEVASRRRNQMLRLVRQLKATS